MGKNRIKRAIGIAIPLLLIIVGICYSGYIRAHTYTLSGNEQVQSINGTVKVTSPFDTEVIFIEVKTGDNYAIPYITSGGSESIKLEKGKWYNIESGKGLVIRPENVRIE